MADQIKTAATPTIRIRDSCADVERIDAYDAIGAVGVCIGRQLLFHRQIITANTSISKRIEPFAC